MALLRIGIIEVSQFVIPNDNQLLRVNTLSFFGFAFHDAWPPML